MDYRKLSLDDESKYKKKSKKKGQPRADHKHEYKTVLLFTKNDDSCSLKKSSFSKRPVKVCAVCGRIGYTDMEQYDRALIPGLPFKAFERVIKDEEYLEKWYADSYFSKFAKRKL